MALSVCLPAIAAERSSSKSKKKRSKERVEAPAVPSALRASVISGLIVDGAGQPVEGVSVSFQWRADDKGLTPLFDEGVSDAQGRFSVEVIFPMGGRPVALLALNRGRTLGALQEVLPGQQPRLELGPLRNVAARCVATESGEAVSAEVAIYVGNAKPRFVWAVAPQGRWSVPLPPGEMWYGVKSNDRIEVRALLELEAGESTLEIGSIPLDPLPPES